MVAHRGAPGVAVDFSSDVGTGRDVPAGDAAAVHGDATEGADGIDLDFARRAEDAAAVANLAAAFRVEGAGVEHEFDLRALLHVVDRASFGEEQQNVRFGRTRFVADKRRRAQVADGGEERFVLLLGPRLAAAAALLLEGSLEAGFVDRPAPLFQRLHCEVQREAERVVEAEGVFAG